MKKKTKEGDGIHVRALGYGYKRPKGFMWKEIEKWYRGRGGEWLIVKKFLNDAHDNFTRGLNRETPYILLEQLGNKNADNCKYTLGYQAYIQYFEYEKLQQAKKDSELAFWVAFSTLVITLLAFLFSIYFSIRQINSSAKIDSAQHRETLQFPQKEEPTYSFFAVVLKF